jgi:hypothetical protein
MLDKSLAWYRVILKREAGTALPEAALSPGYSIVAYQAGDEEAWADIEFSVLEFDSKAAALEYFTSRYIPYEDEVKRRTIFIQSDIGEKNCHFYSLVELYR